MCNHIISEELARLLVQSIEDATGDVIKEDLIRNNLIFQNSTPHRIWDHVFTLITKRLQAKGYQVISTNSGPWKFPIIFDHTSGNIITIMREKRFADLKRQQPKRHKRHYLDMLVQVLNKNLQAPFEQLSLQEKVQPNTVDFEKCVGIMLQDLESKADLVRNHVLVLFSANNFHLHSVRAIKITPELEIAENGEENLSGLIASKPSVIVSRIQREESLVDAPTFSLKLTKKAIERQNRLKVKDYPKQEGNNNA